MIRVVSLLPAATEIVAALGMADRLVGISHECDYPTSIAHLPRVTRSALHGTETAADIDLAVRTAADRSEPLATLDDERITDLAPSLIFTQAVCDVCAVRERDVCALAERLPSRPRVVTLGATTLGEVGDDIARVADALDAAEMGRSVRSAMDSRMQEIHQTLTASGAPRPRVAILEWTDPPYTAGHWVPEMIRRAGGRDVLGRSGERSRVATVGEFRKAAPEIVIVAPCGYDAERAVAAARALLCNDQWGWLRQTSLWVLDSNALLSRPGPRLSLGVETLAQIFHPRLFPTPDSDYARPLPAA